MITPIQAFDWAFKLDAPFRELGDANSWRAKVMLSQKEYIDHQLAQALYLWYTENNQ